MKKSINITYLLLAIWLFLVTSICLLPGSFMAQRPWIVEYYIDKVFHLFLFFVLGQLTNRLFSEKALSFWVLSAVVLFEIVFSAATEVIQQLFIPGRSGDYVDWYCNVCGLILGLTNFKSMLKNRCDAATITKIKLVLWTLFVSYLCLSPATQLPEIGWLSIPHFDKVMHFCMFFGCGFLTYSLYVKQGVTRSQYMSILVAILVYAAVIEVVQQLYILGRSGDIFDWLCDAAGLFVAVGTFGILPKWLVKLVG